MGLGSGLAYGVGQGANAPEVDPMRALQIQDTVAQQKAREQEQERLAAQQEAVAKYAESVPPELRSLVQAFPAEAGRAATRSAFTTPKTPQYGQPVAVMGPDGKPTLIRVPKSGGEPLPVSGYSPMPKAGGTGEPSINERMRWIAMTGKDPLTGRPMSRQDAMQALAPGSQPRSREEFQEAMALQAMRTYTDPKEAAQKAGELWDSLRDTRPAAPEPQEVEEPGLMTRGMDYLRDLAGGGEATAQPGGGVTVPIPKDVPTMATEFEAMPETDRDAALRRLLQDDPAAFDELMKYLESR